MYSIGRIEMVSQAEGSVWGKSICKDLGRRGDMHFRNGRKGSAAGDRVLVRDLESLGGRGGRDQGCRTCEPHRGLYPEGDLGLGLPWAGLHFQKITLADMWMEKCLEGRTS